MHDNEQSRGLLLTCFKQHHSQEWTIRNVQTCLCLRGLCFNGRGERLAGMLRHVYSPERNSRIRSGRELLPVGAILPETKPERVVMFDQVTYHFFHKRSIE